MEEQEFVRLRLNEYMRKNGIKASWVSQMCKIDASLLSRFRSGKKELWDETLNEIKSFLAKRGY